MSDSNEPSDTVDRGLESLFRRTHAGIADGAFSAATMRRIELRNARSRLWRRLLEGACIIAIVAASPWLIDASVRLSTLLEMGLARATDWLATPAGVAIAFAGIAFAVAVRPLVVTWAPVLWRRATRWR